MEKVEIEPETCLVAAPVRVTLNFRVKEALEGVKWSVDYVVDSTGKRLTFKIFETEVGQNYEANTPLNFSFETPDIGEHLAQVKRKQLLNIGLLKLQAVDGRGVEQLQVNFVVQVRKEGEELVKTVLNPLE